jgi:membrane fusion protein, multidrug efflux system
MANSETVTTKKLSRVAKWSWFITLLAAALVGGHYAVSYMMDSLLYESTDDAFVDGHIVAISSKVAGHVQRVLIADNQEVKKGALLVEIEPQDYAVRVKATEATLLAARASVEQVNAEIIATRVEADRAKTDLTRYKELSPTNSISQQQLDRAAAAAEGAAAKLDSVTKMAAVAQARIAEAEAALEGAKLQLSYTNVYAPQDGRVTKKSVEAGALIDRGQPLMAIVTQDFWVIANFKETQLAGIRPGQPVAIRVDAFPNTPFKGHVDSIQSGTGARFSLLPSENATGNYVKVVQRVPVKIVFDADPNALKALSPGMSVLPRVRVVEIGKHDQRPRWKRWLGF